MESAVITQDLISPVGQHYPTLPKCKVSKLLAPMGAVNAFLLCGTSVYDAFRGAREPSGPAALWAQLTASAHPGAGSARGRMAWY